MGKSSDGQFRNLDVTYNYENRHGPLQNFEGTRRKVREPQEVEGNLVVFSDEKPDFDVSYDSLNNKIDPTTKVKIGRGQFGEVFKCKSKDGRTVYALKEIDVERNGIADLENEVRTLRDLQHVNIVSFVDFSPKIEEFSFVKKVYLLMEFMPDTLTSFLDRNKNKRNNETFIVPYIHQLLNAVRFLHSRNIVHCDIKSDNILFDDSKGLLKLCDFGLAHNLCNGKVTQPNRGTINFMSPQAIKATPKNGYGKDADIWSCGCTFYEMMTGWPPFFEFESMTIMFKVGSGFLKPEPPAGCSPLCQNFLMRCWTDDPTKRATVEELLAHPFIQGENVKYPTECSELDTDDFDTTINDLEHFSLPCSKDKGDSPDVMTDEFAPSFALIQDCHNIEDMPTYQLVLQQRCQDHNDEELVVENFDS